jgi:2'-5' RNA ligase
MTLPPVVRVFFAIELPPSAKEKLGSFIGTIKKRAKSRAIRWAKPENLHITLQFLAEVQSAHLPHLIENVRTKIARKVKKSTLTFGELHLFPNPYRPRVIVLDITPQEELAALAGWIGEGIKLTDYEIENRPFRGHLTLGRIKQPKGLDLSFLSEFPAPEAEKVDLNEIVLFRSEPLPEGSKYSVIEKLAISD